MDFRVTRPAEAGGIGKRSFAAALTLLLAGFAVRLAFADVVTFQSGAVLEGHAVPVHGLTQRTARHAQRPGATGSLPEPWWVVDDGVRYYFTPARNTQVEQRQELSRVPEFTLPRTVRARLQTPDVIGTTTATPFDNYGRRTITLKTAKGPTPIQQEITRIRPDYVEVTGSSHEWSMGLDTSTLPDDLLQALLRRASDPNKIDDRKAIISLYLDARRFDLATQELSALLKEHPELNDWGQPQLPLIQEQKYRAAINKVLQRRKAGQHRLAYFMATEALKAEVPADSLLQCQEILAEYEAARENAGQVQMLLETYEAELPNEQAAKIRVLRPQLLAELQFESLPRLEPFLRARDDKGLSSAQRLALAYSGWVVGPSFADVDLNVAINLWEARFHVLEYIRENSNSLRRDDFIAELKKLEGVTMQRLAEMVPLLPYVIEQMLPAPGEPRAYSFNLEDGLPVQYAVTLPSEYNPAHRYPAIVVLRRSGMSLEDTLRWWAGSAEKEGMAMSRGYIVIAPEFAAPESGDYDYDIAAHRRVMAALTDARKKFAIDSDRIFIAGHELGGEATFDIAMSHPDLFAGAAPFVARMDRYPRYLLANSSHVPWYVVTGERHLPGGPNDSRGYGQSLGSINDMAVKQRADVTYVEYKARGFESYHEELQRLFDWMDTHRRESLREIRDGWELQVLRPTDTRFFWVQAAEIPAKPPINWERPQGAGIRPMKFSGRIGTENKMYVSVPSNTARPRATIWLSPSFCDFDKRFRVVLNDQDQTRINSLIEPEPAALLEDFRVRGDRQQLFWAKVDL